MVKLNNCRVDGRMNLLKLSNCFVLVFEGNLTQKCLFFFQEKRFVRNQSHQVTYKSTYGLSLDDQQGGVSMIYGNITLMAEAQAITSILFFLRYWSLSNHVGHIHRTKISPGSGTKDRRNNRYSDNSGGLSEG